MVCSPRSPWFWIWVSVVLLVVVPWGSFEDHMRGHRIGWIPFISPPVQIVDVVLNVFLYVPVGYLGSRRSGWRSALSVVLCALALSVATEATQLFSHRRFVSATDVLSNTLGAAIGIFLSRRHRGSAPYSIQRGSGFSAGLPRCPAWMRDWTRLRDSRR